MISGRSVQPLGRFPAESDGESARADGGASDDGACGPLVWSWSCSM